MSKVDFHCHTKYSRCSNLEPKTILKICRKTGIKGIMICDHGVIKGALAFKKLIPKDEDFVFIPGIEILTDQGEIIGAWMEKEPKTNDYPEVID